MHIIIFDEYGNCTAIGGEKVCRNGTSGDRTITTVRENESAFAKYAQ